MDLYFSSGMITVHKGARCVSLQYMCIPRLLNFLRNSTIHFWMFLSLVTCDMRVMVSLLCRSQPRTILSRFINNVARDKFEYVSLIQLVTGIATKTWLWKHVIKYYNTWKLMFEFLRKSESRVDKIAPVNSIRINKSINSFNFVWRWGQLW